MNTTNLKKYAPQARRDFMAAISQRLNQFGIHADSKGKLTVSTPVVSGSVIQIEGMSFDAGLARSREKLVQRAESLGFEQLVEQMAYTWFNRLSAIRFMELHGYLDHNLRVLSPSPLKGEGRGEGFQPEILAHAQDVATDLGLDRNHIVELKLAGNKDEELYRTLLLGQCHQLHQAMPFLFEALDDETELLLPDNLTRTDSILRGLVDSIPEDDWQQVEIIGWLYQFYISEKKDQVIGNVVKSEDIPAATQLFTPNWIVKYLVQNSVGRQWLMTYPDSGLKARMEYYIEPAEQEPSVVEAYDILKAIYEERGYRVRDIPKLILEKNLYGLDIDDRAAQLAGFALMMKAREDDRRIFTRDIKLNVLAIQSTQNLDLPDLWRKLSLNQDAKRGSMESIFDDVQSNLADTMDDIEFKQLRAILALFEQAKTLGSLIQVPQEQAEYLRNLTSRLQELIEQGDSMQKLAAATLFPYVQQAWILAQQYDVVVANPPYMGGKGMNAALKEFAKKQFPDSKSDLFAMFMERAFEWCKPAGFNAQVNMQRWMFLSSYEALREKLLSTKTINTMAHLGARAFSEISGEVVQTTAFVFHGDYFSGYKPAFFRLVDGNEEQKQTALLSDQNRFDKTVQEDFNKIPGCPIAYWVSDKVRDIFANSQNLGEVAKGVVGLQTGDNDRFLRLWYEIDLNCTGFGMKNREQSQQSELKWFPYNKGGDFRKWYGNQDFVVNWENDGEEIRNFVDDKGKQRSRPQNTDCYFQKSISWSFISSSFFGVRLYPYGFIFDVAGSSLFAKENSINSIIGFLCSSLSYNMMQNMNPTLNFQVGNVVSLPFIAVPVDNIVKDCIELSKTDWNSYETSWDFTETPLILKRQNSLISAFPIVPTLQRGNAVSDAPASRNAGALPDAFPRQSVGTIKAAFEQWQTQSRAAIAEMQRLEEENNRLFIEAYGLQDELTPEVPEDQITLTRADQEKDIQRLISYAIGCMMGRYRLDRPGLVYAHAGNADFDEIYYQKNVGWVSDSVTQQSTNADVGLRCANPTYAPDEDGILPLTDQEWFKDDATNRFREFLVAVWGEDSLQQNLEFVAESLTLSSFKPKKGETSLDTVRRYLSNQFYKDHLQTYKKRPIYWLFSSGKQKAFECLVYLHRYNESTLARMRTEYVTPLLGKYSAYADQLNQQLQDASSSEATRIKKDMLALEKKQTELRQFDDKLKHYADMRIKIDLDDGVKVNYGKFGDLLAEVKQITGGDAA